MHSSLENHPKFDNLREIASEAILEFWEYEELESVCESTGCI